MNNNEEEFFLAAMEGDIEKVTQLITHSGYSYKTEALRVAAERGHIDIVELLIPVSDPKADESWPLRLAAKNGHLAVVKALIPVSDPKAKNSYALDAAIVGGHIDIVKELIPVSNKPHHLIRAIKAGFFEIFKLLLPVSEPKYNDSQALLEAAELGHVEMVKLLIPVSGPMEKNCGALAMAAKSRHSNVVDILMPFCCADKAAEMIDKHGILEWVDLLTPHLSRSCFRKVVKQAKKKDGTLANMPVLQSIILERQLAKELPSVSTQSRPRTRI